MKANRLLEVHLDNGEIIDTKAVIIATGSSAKYLGIEGEEEAIGKVSRL
ncbi:MAG: hypothetical protein ACLS5K_05470 [Streptococcus salivarius]